ncbi:MAG: 1-deoxy-D-xylulose-5-phosphate synthase [Clostridiales bacterium]
MGETYLERINDLQDIKKLSIPELKVLSQELREYILAVVSQNGGHLSSNLGVIELTVALEYVFQTDVDRLVWDVGHQSYAHKILTGRREAFKTLRQMGGLSGFPKREESPCDTYDTGHSSTSIAAALGFAKARDLKNEDHKVIAVIGDGSMTGGPAFEALNLAGALDTDVLVILNDNRMSIAPNIGGISNYLNRLRSSAAYAASKQAVRRALSQVPVLGKGMIKIIETLKEGLRYIMVNGIVFSELGFQYYGPVDGHDLHSLIEMLEHVKEIKGPVMLHVVTEKGRGYKPAVENAAAFHGIAPFDLETGKTNGSGPSQAPTYTSVFSKTLLELAGLHPEIIGITAAMSDGTGLEEFRRQYPDRFFDVGIAEQTAVSFGTALALSGYRPVVAVYSSFLQRGYDQLLQDAALQKAPLILALDRSGLVGEDGPTHHGVFDLSYLSHIPHMTVMVPRDEAMLSQMLELAFQYKAGPVALRYPRGKGKGREIISGHQLAWGSAQLLRPGYQVLIVAAGPLVYEGLAAARRLEAEGYSVGVLDPCFLKPLDKETIWSAAKWCNLVVTAEENVAAGGLGWAVTRLLSEAGYHGRVNCLCIPDDFITQGSQAELRELLHLNAEGLAAAVREGLI